MATTLLGRFSGPDNLPRLVAALEEQKLCIHAKGLAEQLAKCGQLLEVKKGHIIIKQDDWDTDIFFIIAGKFSIVINGQYVNTREAGVHVGELAGLNGARARTATVAAEETSLVLKVGMAEIEKLTEGNDKFWREVANTAADRLDERNRKLGQANQNPRLFIISSSEALRIADLLQSNLDGSEISEGSKIHCHTWRQGTFGVSSYPIIDLEDAIEAADFVVAIARSDDSLVSRRKSSDVPRDNVILEYGMAIGRLGRPHAILLVDGAKTPKLPTDLTGLTVIYYDSRTEDDLRRTIATACSEIREHIRKQGVRRDRLARS